MLLIGLIVFCLVVGTATIFLLINVLYRAAKEKQQASFVAENTIEYVVAGEDLVDIIVNREGHELVESDIPGGEIKKVDPGRIRLWTPQRYIEEKWGFYWVSIFYPWRKIHKFPIFRARIKPKSGDDSSSAVDRYELDAEPTTENHLQATPIMTVLVKGAETKDGLGVDLLFQITTEVVYPYIPIFTLGGKYKTVFDSAVSEGVNNYMVAANVPDFKAFRDMQKDGLVEALKQLNEVPTAKTPDGMEKSVGLRITKVILDSYSLGKEHADAQAALKQKEIAKAKGEAKITEAEAQKRADELFASGRAAYLREEVAALNGASPEALQVIATTNQAKELAGSKTLQVLSLGKGRDGLVQTFDTGNVTHQNQPKRT